MSKRIDIILSSSKVNNIIIPTNTKVYDVTFQSTANKIRLLLNNHILEFVANKAKLSSKTTASLVNNITKLIESDITIDTQAIIRVNDNEIKFIEDTIKLYSTVYLDLRDSFLYFNTGVTPLGYSVDINSIPLIFKMSSSSFMIDTLHFEEISLSDIIIQINPSHFDLNKTSYVGVENAIKLGVCIENLWSKYIGDIDNRLISDIDNLNIGNVDLVVTHI